MPKKIRRMFLEERIALARRALNESTFLFEEHIRPVNKAQFQLEIRALMAVLEGDPFGLARKYFAALTTKPRPSSGPQEGE